MDAPHVTLLWMLRFRWSVQSLWGDECPALLGIIGLLKSKIPNIDASKQTRIQNLFAVLILIHSSVEFCLSVNSKLKYSSVMCQGKNSRWKCSGKMTDNVLSVWIKYSERPFYASFDSLNIKILSAPCSGA